MAQSWRLSIVATLVAASFAPCSADEPEQGLGESGILFDDEVVDSPERPTDNGAASDIQDIDDVFDGLAFGGVGPNAAAAARARLLLYLDQKIVELDDQCSLTDSQRRALRVAGHGDATRISRRADDLRKTFHRVYREQPNPTKLAQWGSLIDEPFGTNSLFSKTRQRVLTEQQRGQIEGRIHPESEVRYNSSRRIYVKALLCEVDGRKLLARDLRLESFIGPAAVEVAPLFESTTQLTRPIDVPDQRPRRPVLVTAQALDSSEHLASLCRQGIATIRSRPLIRTNHGQSAAISIGYDHPMPEMTSVIKVEIVPTIEPNDDIRLNISIHLSILRSLAVISGERAIGSLRCTAVCSSGQHILIGRLALPPRARDDSQRTDTDLDGQLPDSATFERTRRGELLLVLSPALVEK